MVQRLPQDRQRRTGTRTAASNTPSRLANRSGATENDVRPSIDSPISRPALKRGDAVGARRRLVVDADLAKADPARQPLEETVALGKLAQRSRGARRQQAEVAGILRDFLPRAPIDQRVEAVHGDAAQQRFVVAMRLGGIDHVVAAIEPMADQLLDQVRRMLAVAVHEQHGAAPGMVEARHQARLPCRNCATATPPGRRARRPASPRAMASVVVGAAVVDIDDLAGEAVALPQRLGEAAEPVVQRREPGRLVVQRHDDRQPLRRSSGRGGGQARNVGTQRHRSGSTIRGNYISQSPLLSPQAVR